MNAKAELERCDQCGDPVDIWSPRATVLMTLDGSAPEGKRQLGSFCSPECANAWDKKHKEPVNG